MEQPLPLGSLPYHQHMFKFQGNYLSKTPFIVHRYLHDLAFYVPEKKRRQIVCACEYIWRSHKAIHGHGSRGVDNWRLHWSVNTNSFLPASDTQASWRRRGGLLGRLFPGGTYQARLFPNLNDVVSWLPSLILVLHRLRFGVAGYPGRGPGCTRST